MLQSRHSHVVSANQIYSFESKTVTIKVQHSFHQYQCFTLSLTQWPLVIHDFTNAVLYLDSKRVTKTRLALTVFTTVSGAPVMSLRAMHASRGSLQATSSRQSQRREAIHI